MQRHEASIAPDRRLELGAHYTPPAVAARLVGLACRELGRVPTGVMDPSCGAGSILLAAADELLAMGVPPGEVPARLVGADVDPEALAVAAAAIRAWSRRHGVGDAAPARLLLGDALGGVEVPPGVEILVGNPPFSSPLTAGVASGSGSAHGPYTDWSARHLLAAVESCADGAVVCMLQPQSVLGGRDAGAVRARLADLADLVGMWITDEQPFAAAVQVCAPVLRRRTSRPGRPVAVEVHWRDDPPGSTTIDPAGSWSGLLARAMGVPVVQPAPPGGLCLEDFANCTAGFRDEFYALAEAAVEFDQRPGATAARTARLVTSGMIEPGRLDWGVGERRLAGRGMLRPVVDVDGLTAISEKVQRWARQRTVPKVLVASQTRILEAVLDRCGDCIGVTPVISVEPRRNADHAGCEGSRMPIEAIAGLIAAPSSSARVAAVSAGTGRSTGSLRISASVLGSLPFPRMAGSIERLAATWCRLEEAATSGGDLVRLGAELDSALGLVDTEVLDWWAERVERRVRT